MQIQCTNCGKTIEKKGQRTLCIKCTNLFNKIRFAQKRATDEYKEYQRQYKKKEGLI